MPVVLFAVVVDVVAEVVAVVVILSNVLAVGIHVVRVWQRLAKLPIWRRSRGTAPHGKRRHPWAGEWVSPGQPFCDRLWGTWTERIWLGASVENRKSLGRLDALRASSALVRFLSVEPLLEDLGALDLRGIRWVIVGGESGPGFRPMDHAWARQVRDQCVAAGVPFFFKQSAARRTEVGTALVEADGSTTVWHQYPDEPAQPQRRAPIAGGGGDVATARGRSGSRRLPLGLGRKS